MEYVTLTKQKNIVTSKNISTEEWYSKGVEVEVLRNMVKEISLLALLHSMVMVTTTDYGRPERK